jgi:hypothetical protein
MTGAKDLSLLHNAVILPLPETRTSTNMEITSGTVN